MRKDLPEKEVKKKRKADLHEKRERQAETDPWDHCLIP